MIARALGAYEGYNDTSCPGAYEGYNDSTVPWGLHLLGLMRAITIARALGAPPLGAYEGDNDSSCPVGL